MAYGFYAVSDRNEPISVSATQAKKSLLQRRVDLEKLEPRLRAIYLADQIKDPVERCLNFPSVEGVTQTNEFIEYICESVVRKWDFAELMQLLKAEKAEDPHFFSWLNLWVSQLSSRLSFRQLSRYPTFQRVLQSVFPAIPAP